MAVINHGKLVVQGSVSHLLEREMTGYSLEVKPLKGAIELIGKLPWAEILSSENDKIEVCIRQGHASELNQLLVSNQIEVFSLYPHRTLEDFFLEITQGTSEI
jgi:ABC-type multidrug transport system ATPase subunit